MKKFIYIISVFVLASCQDIENCDSNDEMPEMVLEFLSRETQLPVKVGFTITASGSPYSFEPFEDSTGVGLPLDPNAETVTFFFDSLQTSVRYELEMSYETQVSIFDEACRTSVTFLNLDTLDERSYTFDSLSIPGTTTNRLIQTNVQVFF